MKTIKEMIKSLKEENQNLLQEKRMIEYKMESNADIIQQLRDIIKEFEDIKPMGNTFEITELKSDLWDDNKHKYIGEVFPEYTNDTDLESPGFTWGI